MVFLRGPGCVGLLQENKGIGTYFGSKGQFIYISGGTLMSYGLGSGYFLQAF